MYRSSGVPSENHRDEFGGSLPERDHCCSSTHCDRTVSTFTPADIAEAKNETATCGTVRSADEPCQKLHAEIRCERTPEARRVDQSASREQVCTDHQPSAFRTTHASIMNPASQPSVTVQKHTMEPLRWLRVEEAARTRGISRRSYFSHRV